MSFFSASVSSSFTRKYSISLSGSSEIRIYRRGYASGVRLGCAVCSYLQGAGSLPCQVNDWDGDNSDAAMANRRNLVKELMSSVTGCTADNEALWAAYKISDIQHVGVPYNFPRLPGHVALQF